MSLAYLVYVSSSALDADDPAYASTIDGLLEVARRNNAATGVTGALLYNDHGFAQYLEGDAEDVEATYARIAADLAHHALRRSALQPIKRRRFGAWSMAFAGPPGDAVPLTDAPALNGIDVDSVRERRALISRMELLSALAPAPRH